MADFTGLPCLVCKQAFVEGDDIVVCPECGAPYHRACYQQAGHCVLDRLHETGEQWQPPVTEEPPEQPEAHAHGVLCPRCGTENPEDALLCLNCGWRLGAAARGGQGTPWSQQPGPWQGPQGGGGDFSQNRPPFDQPPPSFGAFFQQGINFGDEMADGVSYKEVSDFVGPNNLKFLMKFQLLLRGAAVSFNWPAFLFSFFYCFYRKMYKVGAIVLAITLAVLIPTTVFTSLYYAEVIQAYGVDAFLNPLQLPVVEGQWLGLFQFFSNLSNFVTVVLSLGIGVLFNKLYMKESVRRIKSVRETGHYSTGSVEYAYALARTGGVTVGPVLALAAGYCVLNFLGAFFAIT